MKDGEQFLSCVSFEARSSGRASSFQLMGIRCPTSVEDRWVVAFQIKHQNQHLGES